MDDEDFIDYLNNSLLPRFDVANIEFKLDMKLISCMIGRNRNGDFVWYSFYEDYDEFFMGGFFNKDDISFFEHCRNFLKYYDSDYLYLTENDLEFLKIMSSFVGCCSSIEELELRLSIMGY